MEENDKKGAKRGVVEDPETVSYRATDLGLMSVLTSWRNRYRTALFLFGSRKNSEDGSASSLLQLRNMES